MDDGSKASKATETLLRPRLRALGLVALVGWFTVALAPARSVAPAAPAAAELFVAINSDDPGEVRRLLASGTPPDARDADGTPALVAAARLGLDEIGRTLLDAGADPGAADSLGRTALHAVVRAHRDVDREAAFVELLLARGADLEVRDRTGATPLLVAVLAGDRDQAARLLDAGADPDAASLGRGRPLLVAAGRGERDLVVLLLAAGADLDAGGGGYGTTALMAAATSSWPGAVELIGLLAAAGADIDARNALGQTALHLAVHHRPASLTGVDLLLRLGADLEVRDEHGWTPLLVALDSGSPAAVERLLAAGADPQVYTPGGSTAWSVMEAAAETFEPVAQREPELHALLEAAGARRDLPAAERNRRLTEAVVGGSLDEVRRLLAEGADPEATVRDEIPVLVEAVTGGHGDIARALLAAGANPDAVDLAGQGTALSSAVLRRDVALVRDLFAAGASPAPAARHGRPVALPLGGIADPEMIEALRAGGVEPALLRAAGLLLATRAGDLGRLRTLLADGEGFDVSAVWEDSQLLHIAASAGHTRVVAELLRRGAAVEAPAMDGSTPLCFAATSGRLEAVRQLLEAGADPNAQSVGGWTPLLCAVTQGHEEVALELLAAGAKPQCPDFPGSTPLHWAAGRGLERLTAALLAAGADPEARDDQGRIPLEVATAAGHDEVARRLRGTPMPQ